LQSATAEFAQHALRTLNHPEIAPITRCDQRTVAKCKTKHPHKKNFRFIDLFAGIGGLRRGFEPLGGNCVFTSEWNRYSQMTYRANYHCEHELAGDITQVSIESIPKHDLLLAGFPCQPFSIAGVSKKNALGRAHGFRCEAQGTLFFDVARIIEYHRPQTFLLENVKNLLNHDRGRTFTVIQRVLTQELGYHIHCKVIDARSWVPQHRERIFIVGFRESNTFSFDNLPIPCILVMAQKRQMGTIPKVNYAKPHSAMYCPISCGVICKIMQRNTKHGVMVLVTDWWMKTMLHEPCQPVITKTVQKFSFAANRVIPAD